MSIEIEKACKYFSTTKIDGHEKIMMQNRYWVIELFKHKFVRK